MIADITTPIQVWSTGALQQTPILMTQAAYTKMPWIPFVRRGIKSAVQLECAA